MNLVSIAASDAPLRARPTSPPFPAAMVAKTAGREKRPLGDLFGLANFGVNLTRLAPGACSALRHAHAKQDEFVYVLEGEATLVSDAGETVLRQGMCAGFKAGTGDAHHLVNRSKSDVLFLEIGVALSDGVERLFEVFWVIQKWQGLLPGLEGFVDFAFFVECLSLV